MFHQFTAAVLCVAFSLALSGCQTNVVTAPHATFMIDSKMSCPPVSK